MRRAALTVSAALSTAAALDVYRTTPSDSPPASLPVLASNAYDVIVYGATPAGCAAAWVAANGTGLRVALLEVCVTTRLQRHGLSPSPPHSPCLFFLPSPLRFLLT
jgi:hypothetical protein